MISEFICAALALFEGTSWQMLETSMVQEGREIVDLDLYLPLSNVQLDFWHSIVMIAWPPDCSVHWRLVSLRTNLGHGVSAVFQGSKSTLARQIHFATLVHALEVEDKKPSLKSVS